MKEFNGKMYESFVRYCDPALDALVKKEGKDKSAEKKRMYDEMVQSMPTDLAAVREQVNVMYSKVARIEELIVNLYPGQDTQLQVDIVQQHEPILEAEATQQV